MPYKDPEMQRAYMRAWRQARKEANLENPKKTPVNPLLQSPEIIKVKIKTAQDILNIISEEIMAVRLDTDSKVIEKARTIGYLAGIALKAIEASNIEERLTAIEAHLSDIGQKAG